MPETEAPTRHAGDLNGDDIGSRVTLYGSTWTISGMLAEVTHGGSDTVVTLGTAEPVRWSNEADLTIGPWSGQVPPDTAVSTG